MVSVTAAQLCKIEALHWCRMQHCAGLLHILHGCRAMHVLGAWACCSSPCAIHLHCVFPAASAAVAAAAVCCTLPVQTATNTISCICTPGVSARVWCSQHTRLWSAATVSGRPVWRHSVWGKNHTLLIWGPSLETACVYCCAYKGCRQNQQSIQSWAVEQEWTVSPWMALVWLRRQTKVMCC